MPRTNEPDGTSTIDHPEDKKPLKDLLAAARTPAVSLNLNIGSASTRNGEVKGLAALTIETLSEAARQSTENGKSASEYSAENIAIEVLDLDPTTARELFNGPSDIGNERAWITPKQAAEAIRKVACGETPWSGLDVAQLKADGRADDYGTYWMALAEETVFNRKEFDAASPDDWKAEVHGHALEYERKFAIATRNGIARVPESTKEMKVR